MVHPNGSKGQRRGAVEQTRQSRIASALDFVNSEKGSYDRTSFLDEEAQFLTRDPTHHAQQPQKRG